MTNGRSMPMVISFVLPLSIVCICASRWCLSLVLRVACIPVYLSTCLPVYLFTCLRSQESQRRLHQHCRSNWHGAFVNIKARMVERILCFVVANRPECEHCAGGMLE